MKRHAKRVRLRRTFHPQDARGSLPRQNTWRVRHGLWRRTQLLRSPNMKILGRSRMGRRGFGASRWDPKPNVRSATRRAVVAPYSVATFHPQGAQNSLRTLIFYQGKMVGRRGFEPLKAEPPDFKCPRIFSRAWTISSPSWGGGRLVSARPQH